MNELVAIEPNLLDRVISYIDPVRGVKRRRARYLNNITSSYIGASTLRRQTKSWMTTSGDADADTILDLFQLRMRSRDLVRNCPLATGAINTVTTNVVGSGLKLKCRVDRQYLGISDDDASIWERNTEREFNLWAESQDSDAARSLDFYGHQGLAFRQVLENGDIFYLMLRFNRDNDNPYTLKIQAIEADRITNRNFQINSTKLAGGVEKDDYGAPVAYHILKQHPGAILPTNPYEWDIVPAYGEKTGIKNVIHLYSILRPNQSRGVPYLAPVIEPLKQLDRYTEAEIMAAVVNGMLTVFIETEGGGGMGLNTPDIVSASAPATSTNTTYQDEIKLGAGTIVGLDTGEKIAPVIPNRPNSQYDAFVMSILRQVGVALELPFEVLIKHYTSSYSAARAALLEVWRFFRVRRDWLASNFCQQVYENWLYEAIAIGRVQAPGFFTDPMVRKAYSGTRWIGDAQGAIDPLKEVSAAQMRLSLGLSSLDEEVTSIGGDLEYNMAQIPKERKRLEEIGLWMPVQYTSKNIAPELIKAPDIDSDPNEVEKEQ